MSNHEAVIAQLDEPPANLDLRSQAEAMGYYRSGAPPLRRLDRRRRKGPTLQPIVVSHNTDVQPVTGA
jgi:hypothetical protein